MLGHIRLGEACHDFHTRSSFLLRFSVCRVEMMIIYSKYIIEDNARIRLIETVKLVLLLMLLIIHISIGTLYTINMSFDTSLVAQQ